MEMVFEKKLKPAGLAVLLVIVFAATWIVLDRTEHSPGWLAVEAPHAAFVGKPLEIRVTLKESVEAAQIVCTLHRAGTDRRLREHVASSGPAREAAGGGTYTFLELSGVVGHLAAWGRRLAEEGNLYDLRKPFQKALMAAVAAAALGLFFLFIKAMRKTGSHRFVWGVGIGLAAYLSLSFISVLSFHAIDVVRGMTWHGLSPVDAARGAGALVSLFAAVFALSRKNGTRRG